MLTHAYVLAQNTICPHMDEGSVRLSQRTSGTSESLQESLLSKRVGLSCSKMEGLSI